MSARQPCDWPIGAISPRWRVRGEPYAPRVKSSTRSKVWQRLGAARVIAFFISCGGLAASPFLRWVTASFSDAPAERFTGWGMLHNPDGHLFFVDGNALIGSSVRHWYDGGVLPVMGPAAAFGLAWIAAVLGTVANQQSATPPQPRSPQGPWLWAGAGASSLAAAAGAWWNISEWTGAWGDFAPGFGIHLTLWSGLVAAATAILGAVRFERAGGSVGSDLANFSGSQTMKWAAVAALTALVAIVGDIGLWLQTVVWSRQIGVSGAALLATMVGLGWAVMASSIALINHFRSRPSEGRVAGVWASFVLTFLAVLLFAASAWSAGTA